MIHPDTIAAALSAAAARGEDAARVCPVCAFTAHADEWPKHLEHGYCFCPRCEANGYGRNIPWLLSIEGGAA